jgi:hypothetical protein
MQNIKSTKELKDAIQLLEVEQAEKGQLLKGQFFFTYESFRPVNLLKSTLNDITTSPYLIDNILSTALGLASGFISKKVFIGVSGSKFKKVIGSVLQFGVINFVSQHYDAIKSFGRFFFKYILRRRIMNSDGRDR